MEEAQRFDAFFVTGSVSSANDASQPWITGLREVVRGYVQAQILVVGICFGAQVRRFSTGRRLSQKRCMCFQLLAVALGGRVGPNPGEFISTGKLSECVRPESEGFWCGPVESVEALPVFSKLIASETKTLSMIECHGEQVLELPKGAVLLATSPTCVNEIWCLWNALAIQSHPEFSPEQMFQYILPMLEREKLSWKLCASWLHQCVVFVQDSAPRTDTPE